MSTSQFSGHPAQNHKIWLGIAALLTIILWQVPGGNYVLYPFTLLATWFHEMSHGITALLLGGSFKQLALYANGSGVATHSGHLWLGNLGYALVAAGGPLGPAVAGAVFIMAGRGYRSAHYCLFFLSFMLLLSAILWVVGGFGLIVVGLWGIAVGWIALYTPAGFQSFAIQFFGVQACISTYRQVDYLFTRSVVIDGQAMLSDTGQIAFYLFLPYWFWAALVIGVSLLLLWLSLMVAYRR